MSAESHELLWETNLSDSTSLLDTIANSQTTTEEIGSQSPAVSADAARSTTLSCDEESLDLEDWTNEAQEYPDQESISEAARVLMEARMAAPQGGLDASYASHSWEHPARVEKRKRVYSVTWVDRETPKPPVGMILLIIAPTAYHYI